MSVMVTHAQREDLVLIRGLQTRYVSLLTAGLVVFLAAIVLVARDFMTLTTTRPLDPHFGSLEIFLFIAAVILIAASAYVASSIRRRKCPQCGNFFFIKTPRARIASRASFPAGPLRQQCRNCGLSLGEVAVSEENK